MTEAPDSNKRRSLLRLGTIGLLGGAAVAAGIASPVAGVEPWTLRDRLANRPQPGTEGRLFYAKDAGQLTRDSGTTWESIQGAKCGVWASEFASSGSGTDSDPWPIQSIIDAIDYVIEFDTQDPGRVVYLDAGIFRGTTPINFNQSTKNLSGLNLRGMGMGSPGNITPIGRNTLIDFQPAAGNTLPAIYFGHTGQQTDRVIMSDFALKTNANAVGVIKWEKLFRSSMRNIFMFGNTKDDPNNWAFWGLNSFAGQFNSIYAHNCYKGFNFDHTSNNGFQADIGFLEVDGFAISEGGNPRVGCRFRGILSAIKINVMVVGVVGPNSIGCHITSCKGITAQVYVEGMPTAFVNRAIQVDNSQSVVLTSPTVTRVSGAGFFSAGGNLQPPLLIGPQFGTDSGQNSTGTGVQGGFIVISPVFLSEWTGLRHDGNPRLWIDRAQLASPGGITSLPQNSATPTVRQARLCRTSNTLPTTVTQFINGEMGQEIMIRAGDGLTTIEHGTNIFLKGGVSRTLIVNETLSLAQWTANRWDEF